MVFAIRVLAIFLLMMATFVSLAFIGPLAWACVIVASLSTAAIWHVAMIGHRP